MSSLNKLSDLFSSRLDLSVVMISINDLYNQERFWQSLFAFMEWDLVENALMFQCPADDQKKHSKGCALFANIIPFGSKLIVNVITCSSSEMKPINQGYALVNAERKIEKTFLLDELNDSIKSEIKAQYQSVVSKYSDEGYYTVEDVAKGLQ